MEKLASIFIAFLFSCSPVKTEESKAVSKDTKSNASSVADTLLSPQKTLESFFPLNKDSIIHFQNPFVSVFVGNLFSKDRKHAILRYVENDTLTNIIVLREQKNKWDTIFSTCIYPTSITAWEDRLQITDYDGDNVPDLKVIKNTWDIHIGENSDLWLYKNDHFTKVDGFDSLVSAEYYEETKMIYCYQSTGCADMSMYFGTFKIVNGKIKNIQEMNCDCCEDHNDSCKIDIRGQKPLMVSYKEAPKYVPSFFANAVKEKCEMILQNK